MGTRRQARERAVQFLFQHDHNPPEDLAGALEHFWVHQRPAVIEVIEGKSTWGEEKELPPPTVDDVAIREFAEPLVRGVLEHREEIDDDFSNWQPTGICTVWLGWIATFFVWPPLK